jgi:hypothetical protein
MAFPEAQDAHRSGSNWQVGSGSNVCFGSKADIALRRVATKQSVTSIGHPALRAGGGAVYINIAIGCPRSRADDNRTIGDALSQLTGR